MYWLASEDRESDRKIASDLSQQDALQQYFDTMTDLLLNQKLRESNSGDAVAEVARVRTLAVLRQLNGKRKALLIRFLYDADLIGSKCTGCVPKAGADPIEAVEAVIRLRGADLRNVDLVQAYLRGANFRFDVDLRDADLRGANLAEVELTDADLRGANLTLLPLDNNTSLVTNLSGAVLSGADLRGANLQGANLKGADLFAAELNGSNLSGANWQDAYCGLTVPEGAVPGTLATRVLCTEHDLGASNR